MMTNNKNRRTKRIVINIIGFAALFAIIFALVQPVIVYKDDSGIAVAQFFNEPQGSLDVLIIGASDTRASVLPAVLWEHAGITSYNLSMNGMKSAHLYYYFKDALRFQKPAVVLISTEFVYKHIDFDGEGDEGRLRQVLDNMRWSRVKYDAVKDVLANSEKQKFADYLFPLLRYHDRNDFDEKDFTISYSYKRQRNPHMRAWESVDIRFSEQWRPDWFYETDDIYEYRDEYLQRIIALCRQNDIEPVLIDAPTCEEDELTVPRYKAITEYANMHGITLLNLNIRENYNKLGLDSARDYFDEEHVNIIGGEKISVFIADWLTENYDIPDRRGEISDPHWDAVLAQHREWVSLLREQFPE